MEGNAMRLQYTETKLTDDRERRLIQQEIDSYPYGSGAGASVLAMEIVVGSLLLIGVLFLAAQFG
jgi:hypothetical protein